MIPAWCVKIAKKTQQPTLELSEVPFSLATSTRMETDSSCLEDDAESNTDERRRARDGPLGGLGCEATRAGDTH